MVSSSPWASFVKLSTTFGSSSLKSKRKIAPFGEMLSVLERASRPVVGSPFSSTAGPTRRRRCRPCRRRWGRSCRRRCPRRGRTGTRCCRSTSSRARPVGTRGRALGDLLGDGDELTGEVVARVDRRGSRSRRWRVDGSTSGPASVPVTRNAQSVPSSAMSALGWSSARYMYTCADGTAERVVSGQRR